ncbi:MAG: DR2241 family protein [Verrucomicrobiota bacterium]
MMPVEEMERNLAMQIDSLLPAGESRRFGELLLKRNPDGTFLAFHRGDELTDEAPETIDSVDELREIAKYDEGGEYRPLKTAPTLRKGWQIESKNAADFLRKLDAIYPGAFATWIAYRDGQHEATPFRETLDRQTGIDSFAEAITDQMANRIMREICNRGCLRTIAWPIDRTSPVSRLHGNRSTIPVICTEACTFAISEAKRLAKEACEKANRPA